MEPCARRGSAAPIGRAPRKDIVRVKKEPDAVARGPKDVVARPARAGASDVETAAGGGSSTSRLQTGYWRACLETLGR